jgi:hypothetical protein
MISQGPKFITSQSGAKLFLSLAEGVPHLAVNYLKETFGSWSKEDLSNFHEGRREVVFGLEKIVVWPEFFEEGIKLLLALAEAENESWSNNATGVFSDLFLPISKTGANPQKRVKVLREILRSGKKETRLLGLRA